MLLASHRRLITTAGRLAARALGARVAPATCPRLASLLSSPLQPTVSRGSASTVLHRDFFSSSYSATSSSSPTTDYSSLTSSRSHVLASGDIHVQMPPVADLTKHTLRLMREYVQRTPHPPSQDYTTLSFYQFRPIAQEDLVKLQYYFLTDLRQMDVVGRIYVSTEGINAQISCPKDRVDEFKLYYAKHWPIFDKIRFNPAMTEGKAFKKLHVRVRTQLVSDGIDNSTFDLNNEPTYLTPEEWHKELSSLSEPPILIDMRNHYESAIGHFEHSIRPDVTTFRENVDAMLEICQGKEEKDIYMYCTGGIRCTRSGALLKSKGFNSVKMLQGGVTAYGQFIQDRRENMTTAATVDKDEDSGSLATNNEEFRSIYRGKNFTFDKRLGEPITEDVLANCHTCGSPCDEYCNCSNTACNLLMISCPSCHAKHEGTCGSDSCVEMVRELSAKQEQIKKDYPGLIGMKARLGIKPLHEHRLRVRPSTVMEMRKRSSSSNTSGRSVSHKDRARL